MNKKLLAVAVATAVAAPVSALADVDVSAQIQVEASHFDQDNDRIDVRDTDGTRLSGSDASGDANFVAFSATEELGNGWTAFAKINFDFKSTGSSGLTGRDRFVGLKNDLIAISGGRINSAYKKASVRYDPFLATSLQARGNAGMSGGGDLGGFGHSSYIEDVIEVAVEPGYGFSANVQYIFDENEPLDGADGFRSNQNGGTVRDGSWSAFVKWNGALAGGEFGELEVMGSTSRARTDGNDDVPVSPGGKETFTNYKLGAKWSSDALTLAGQYENAEAGVLDSFASGNPNYTGTSGGNNDDEADIWFGSATYKIGNITLAGWGANYDQKNLDGNAWALGGFYNFSKRTRLHAGFRSTDLSGDGQVSDLDEEVWVTGLRFTL